MIKQRRKFNAQNVERFCALVAGSNSEAVACAQIGIRMETLVDWLENKPKFAQRYAKAKSDIQVLATERLLKFTGRDPRAAQYFHVQVNADFRRSPSNGGAAAEEKLKLDPAEHAERLRQIFGVKSEANGEEDDGTQDGMTLSEAEEKDLKALKDGERARRRFERLEAKSLPTVT